MGSPGEQPDGQQEDPEGLVLIDLGGWISGPCLTAEELEELPADWLPQPAPDRPLNGRQRPAR
jgi:hypothetical protein